MNVEEGIRQKILLATISCIDKEGLHAVTIRRIAGEANVNSAAISYYFGSKDNLVREALRATLREGFSNLVEEILEPLAKNPVKALQQLFDFQLDGMFKFPGIYKAHFQEPFLHGEYNPELMEQMNAYLEELLKRVMPLIPEARRKNMKLTVVQIVSAMFFPGMFGGLFKEFAGLDLREPKQRKKYIDHLFKHYLDI